MKDFEEIYQTYFQDIYFYLRRLSGSEEIAEEMTAETFLKALRAIDRFRGECDLRVWLCQIAKNCYYSDCKRKKRMVPFEAADILPVPDAELEERLWEKDTTGRLQQLLHELPEMYREVLMWRVYAQLSFRQIGQIFHKSENWACVTYHRARQKLKEAWERENNET